MVLPRYWNVGVVGCRIVLTSVLSVWSAGCGRAPETDRAILDLGSTDSRARSAAMDRLQSTGPTAIEALRVSIVHGNDLARESSAMLMGMIGRSIPASREVVSILIGALRDSCPSVRSAAACSIAETSPGDGEGARELVAALSDDAAEVRACAAIALKVVRGSPELVVPALSKLLKDGDSAVRVAAARGLGSFGKGARSSMEAMVAALATEGEKRTLLSLLCAMAEVGAGAETAVPRILELVDMGDPDVRAAAMHLAATLGIADAGLLGKLRNGLDDRDVLVREAAAAALGRIGRTDMETMKKLQAIAAGDEDEDVRNAAERAVDEISRGRQ